MANQRRQTTNMFIFLLLTQAKLLHIWLPIFPFYIEFLFIVLKIKFQEFSNQTKSFIISLRISLTITIRPTDSRLMEIILNLCVKLYSHTNKHILVLSFKQIVTEQPSKYLWNIVIAEFHDEWPYRKAVSTHKFIVLHKFIYLFTIYT